VNNLNMVTHRPAERVECHPASVIPPAQSGTTLGATEGVFNLNNLTDPLTSVSGGVFPVATVYPGRSSSGTYTLTVYGAVRTVGLNGATGVWEWVPLFSGSVAATLAHTGAEAAGVIGNGEYLAATITAAANGSADVRVTSYGASVGPASVTFPTQGCLYLKFQTDAAVTDAFVFVSGKSG
jgi:hypothetical protein